jgi:ankyrin repeat protein
MLLCRINKQYEFKLYLYFSTIQERSMSHLLVALSRAAEDGLSDDIEELICGNNCWTDINAPVVLCSDPCGLSDEYGLTPLHRAAWRGHRNAVAALLRFGASHDVRTSSGRTPEDMATDRSVQRILKNHREQLEKPVCTPIAGRTKVLATRLATWVESKMKESVAQELAEGASCTLPVMTNYLDIPRMDRTYQHDLPAIHRAAYFFDRDIMSLIIEKRGPRVLKARDTKGCTPLHWLAASYCEWPIGRYVEYKDAFTLMIGEGASVNVRNSKGRTPCDLMDLNKPDSLRDIRMACLMAEFGARDVNLTDALAYVFCNYISDFAPGAAELLVKHGADPEVLMAYRLRDARKIGTRQTLCKVTRIGWDFGTERVKFNFPMKSGAAPKYVTRDQMRQCTELPASFSNTALCRLAKEFKCEGLWSPARHKTLTGAGKTMINTVMQCARRLSSQNKGLHLPPEIWLHMLSFWSFVRWPVQSDAWFSSN